MKKLLCIFFSLIFSAQLISSNINWTFPPEPLSGSGITATDPQLAMDSSGNAVAAWIENGVVKSRYKLLNLDWGPVSILSGPPASSPRIVSDPNGNATAIWIEGSVIRASSKPFKNVWSAPITISNTNATNPSLAVDPSGDVVAAWTRNGTIETSTKIFGNNWRSSGSIANPGNAAVFPKVAIGGSGSNTTAFLVWHSTAGAVNTVYASSKPISSGSWSKAKAISDGNHQAAYASVAVDKYGDATAVWFSYDNNGAVYSSVVVQSADIPSGGDWSAPVSLSDPGMRNPATLSAKVAYDTTGNVVALWSTSFDDETFSIQSAINPIYGSWSQPQVLISDDLYSNQANLSVCSLGDALAVYLFYNGTALQIQSSELDITGFMNSMWSVPLTISSGTQNAFPSIAATLNGNVINATAVWVTNNGTNNSVVTTTGIETLVLPPSHLSVTQSVNNFGVFSEYYNILHWQASSDPNVVGYLIYRNGVFLQQVSSSTLQIIDDNKVQYGPVTYGVASVDSEGSHSQIITISFP